MEFVILIAALIIGYFITFSIPFLVYEKWSSVKRILLEDDAMLLGWMIVFGLFMATIIAIFLCAMNNTFWHIDYITTEGLWKK